MRQSGWYRGLNVFESPRKRKRLVWASGVFFGCVSKSPGRIFGVLNCISALISLDLPPANLRKIAVEQGNIEAVNGDIIIGQINGKTLVFKEDTNERTLRIGEAKVATKITTAADYIDIDLIDNTGANEKLDVDFKLINGKRRNPQRDQRYGSIRHQRVHYH